MFYSRVLRVVRVVCVSVLAFEGLVLGRGGGEGRAPSSMTAAVERELSESCFFSFDFDVLFMGHLAQTKMLRGSHQHKRKITLGGHY
jgi:hypothetical protein